MTDRKDYPRDDVQRGYPAPWVFSDAPVAENMRLACWLGLAMLGVTHRPTDRQAPVMAATPR